MTRPRATPAAGLAVLAAVALGAPAAAAASSWPSRVVSYADHTQLHRVVRAAVRNWNAATTGLHLVPARRGRGQVRLRQVRTNGAYGESGFGYYPPDGRAIIYAGARDDPADETLVAVVMHEIGHAVGLEHITGACAVMNPIVLNAPACGRARRRIGATGKLCGAQRADARAIVARYGGHVRARRGLGICPVPRIRSPLAPTGRLVAPTRPIVVPDSARSANPVRAVLHVRNTGRWTWGRPGRWTCCRHASRGLSREDVALALLDAPGRAGSPTACDDQFPLRSLARDDPGRPVAPGEAGAFRIELCASGLPSALRLRLESVSDGGRRPGPTFTLRLRRDAAPEAALSTSAGDGVVPPGTDVAFRDLSIDDGGIVRRTWDFGDPDSGAANTSTAAAPTHRYAAAGSYPVTLTVVDAFGQEASTEGPVLVDSGVPPAE